MIIIFVTRRSTNGHRKVLTVDFENKDYQKFPYKSAITRDEFVEVSARDIKRIEKELSDNGFKEV